MRNENFRWGFFGVAGVATICLGFAAKNAFVGGYTRNYANKVIAEITTSNNYTSVRKKVDFLLRDDQYGFLTSQQADSLTKKKGTISLVEEQITSDKFLTESVRWAMAEPITVDNYKGIIFTAATAPQKKRFNLLIAQADRVKLADRKKEAEAQGPILETKKKQSELEKKKQEEKLSKGQAYTGKWSNEDMNSIANQINDSVERVAKKARSAIANGYPYETAKSELANFIRSAWNETIKHDGPSQPNRATVDSLMKENLERLDLYLDRRNDQ